MFKNIFFLEKILYEWKLMKRRRRMHRDFPAVESFCHVTCASLFTLGVLVKNYVGARGKNASCPILVRYRGSAVNTIKYECLMRKSIEYANNACWRPSGSFWWFNKLFCLIWTWVEERLKPWWTWNWFKSPINHFSFGIVKVSCVEWSTKAFMKRYLWRVPRGIQLKVIN